jgi:glycosyltransferase involved in cell wall biosynthesis
VKPFCVFGRAAHCCAGKVECRRHDGAVRVVNPGVCDACPERIERLRIGAVITAFNEGDQVRQTVESLVASIAGPETELHVIVVDDGSSDGSCEPPALTRPLPSDPWQLRLVRHETPQGVGRSRNAGWQEARAWGCHVVSFHDAHMRFGGLDSTARWDSEDQIRGLPAVASAKAGGLEHLARKAVTSGAIVCAGCTGMRPGSNRVWCCDLFYNAADGLQPLYLHNAQVPAEEWPRSPCMMGAGYVISAATAAVLEAATGQLWEDTAGRWGFSEEALSVKAFLMDIPVLFSRDVLFRHLYRDKNPVAEAHREKWRNVCRATRVLFGEAVYWERFRAFCEKRLPKEDVAAISREQAVGSRQFTADSSRLAAVFTHLCGKRATVLEPHPNLAWIEDVKAACARISPPSTPSTPRTDRDQGNGKTEAAQAPALASSLSPSVVPSSASSAAHPVVVPLPLSPAAPSSASSASSAVRSVRVLVWRAGEVLPAIRAIHPQVEIHCIEWSQHRVNTWLPWCRAHNVHLLRVPLGPRYSSPPTFAEATAGEGRPGRFDLVLIGGDLQEECRAHAQHVLAPGGTILLNPSADHEMVADEFRHVEMGSLAKLVTGVQLTPAEATGQLPAKKQPSPPALAAPRPDAGTAQEIVGVPAPADGRGAAPATAFSGERHAGGPPSLTVCLLNWRRPQNIPLILECLAGQTLRPRVVLWNNGEPLPPSTQRPQRTDRDQGNGKTEAAQTPASPPSLSLSAMPSSALSAASAVNLVVQSSRNLGCFPRWALLGQADTEFVATLDDDLILTDERVLEDAVRACREKCPDGIVGIFGWEHVDAKTYRAGRHITPGAEDRRVDVVKGRFMVMRREVLERVPLSPPLPRAGDGVDLAAELIGIRGDDIYVSLCVARGEWGRHLVPACMAHRAKELPQHGASLTGQKGHYEHRDRAVRTVRAWLADRAYSAGGGTSEQRATGNERVSPCSG